MGNTMTQPMLHVFARNIMPTPLLQHLTGEYAPLIAAVWPAPHTEFLIMPTARRHAAVYLLTVAEADKTQSLKALRDALETWSDRQLSDLFDVETASANIMRVLSKCGESLWVMDDYVRLLSLLVEDGAAKAIRHMTKIAENSIAQVELLPAELRHPGILNALPPRKAAVEDLVSAYTLALRMHGQGVAKAIVARWSRAGSSLALFDMAAKTLKPKVFNGILSPLVLPETYRRITRLDELEAVALEFRNCLRDFTQDLSLGRMVIYIHRGTDTPVAIALRQDPAGWRLAEAKRVGNKKVPGKLLRSIVADIEAAGGRTGESLWVLADRLHDHVCKDCGPAHIPPRKTWRQRLRLGSLWN